MLTGNKTFVQDGHIADHFIVVARTSSQAGDADGLTLFLVDAKTDGVRVARTGMVDSRNAAEVSLDKVRVSKQPTRHGGRRTSTA